MSQLNVTIISSPNKRVATVTFTNPTEEDDFDKVLVRVDNIDDIRLEKGGTMVYIFMSAQIVYKLHYSVISSVDGVDPTSNSQLLDLLLTILDAAP